MVRLIGLYLNSGNVLFLTQRSPRKQKERSKIKTSDQGFGLSPTVRTLKYQSQSRKCHTLI